MGYLLAETDRDKTDPKHLCTKCNDLLQEPKQTSCGHRYCRGCIGAILSKENSERKCVQDGTLLREEEVFSDKFVEREILELELHCSRYEKGCQWISQLKHRQDHDRTCEFVEVPCVHSKCGTLVQRSDLARHLENDCSHRKELCSYCGKCIVVVDMMEHHQNDCQTHPQCCPECGNQDIPRCQISVHLDPVTGDCQELKTVCPFTAIGCKETKLMGFNERRDHLKENTPEHMTYLLQQFTKLSSLVSGNGSVVPIGRQLELSIKQIGAALVETNELKTREDQQEYRIKNLEKVVDQVRLLNDSSDNNERHDLFRRVNDQETKLDDLEVFLIEGNKTDADLVQQMDGLKIEQKNLKEVVTKIQRRLESIEHTLGLRNVLLADLEERLRQKEVSNHNGVLLWKISDFARKREDALSGRQVSLYSPPFYSSSDGYKMCVRLYLNGDGMGKGTHISVFFVVMRGPYDALLRWPFRQKVTFMLLDQDHVEHVIDAFRPDPRSNSFERPRRDMNIASGCPTFCHLSELNNHAYVRDDTMFLKVVIDTTDIKTV